MFKKRLLLTVLLLLGVLQLYSAQVRMQVSPGSGKRSIEVGSLFYINIEVSDVEGTPEFPRQIPGAKVLYFDHTGQSSQMTSINGRVTQSVSNSFTVTLRALKEGTFSFGPIVVNGVKSNQLRYTIGKSDSDVDPGATKTSGSKAASQSADSSKPQFIGKGDGNLFLKASVNETSAYEQQALVYTVKLYTTYDAIKFIGATAAPKFDGFVVEESKAISNSLTFETYNGKSYATAIIARYIIFPQMTGKLKVVGNTYTVSVDQREYYHDPFWGNMSVSSPLQLNVTPNDLVINVKALPSPKPADFSGGVGEFKISSQLKGTTFKTNEIGSIVYTVSGTGNLKYIQLPDLSTLYPSQIEIYSPKTDQKIQTGASNVSGSISFDYTFMPLEEGNIIIPEVKLVYFNPSSGHYETSVARGYDISVGKGKASAKSQSIARARFDSELQPISINKLCKQHNFYIDNIFYWLCYILPVLILIISFLIYIKYINEHADIVAFNSKRANKMAQRRLRKAYKRKSAGDREGFYDELLFALWGYLGDKLKMPTSELMRDNIRNVLESNNISVDKINDLLNVIDNAEFAKYSSAGQYSDMNEAYNSAIKVINNLEDGFKNVKEVKKA